MPRSPLLLAAALLLLPALSARAERSISAYDPRLHVKPPTARFVDGSSGALSFDADFRERAARLRQHSPRFVTQAGGVSLVGEVIVVQGDDEILETDGVGFGIRESGLPAIAGRVVARFGDTFEALTIWMTFPDRASPVAEAYELSVKNDVQGLGAQMPVKDMSGSFGSRGVLRSMVNMKTVALRGRDTRDWWGPALETWGQESGHRWMMFMTVRDPRSGRATDMLLGRDCAHYSLYVDTQASVHDGYAWRDNGDGTFTWTERARRYGNLDLYGMGLLASDEVPPFFFIDNVAGYRAPASCRDYSSTARPVAPTISGQRVDVTIDDIVAANGPRVPSADVRQDYTREAQVVLISPRETADSPTARALIDRMNHARLFWEQWMREATRNRMVVCTQVTSDCGDPRSDVAGIAFNKARKAPSSGPLIFELEVRNDGSRPATGVRATLELTIGDETRHDSKNVSRDVGIVRPGETRMQAFPTDLRTVACGTEIKVKATTQSDFHHHRARAAFLLGVEIRHVDAFEADSGWTINPDGEDTRAGAEWERGTPEASQILMRAVQPGAARSGTGAWATGLAATSRTGRDTFVRDGKATLQSPLYDAAELRDPRLRYWVSFAGIRAARSGATVEPSVESRLLVLARAVGGEGVGGGGNEWVAIDRLDDRITAGWEQRTVVLPAAVLGRDYLQLRFVASDTNLEQGGVEVAIDDLEIHSNLAGCGTTAPPSESAGGGCDCALGGARREPGACLLAGLAGAFTLAVRRRRVRGGAVARATLAVGP